MNRKKSGNMDEWIEKGIGQLKAGLRQSPDPLLWEKILSTGLQSEIISASVPESPVKGAWKPVIKIAASTVMAAAAVFTGILLANAYFAEPPSGEKELYRSEIYAESAWLSQPDNELYQYINAE